MVMDRMCLISMANRSPAGSGCFPERVIRRSHFMAGGFSYCLRCLLTRWRPVSANFGG
jgi:hypothetical protein